MQHVYKWFFFTWPVGQTQLEWLYADWKEGIQQASAHPDTEKRVASLRFLEYSMTQEGARQVKWRTGAAIRKAVVQRKVLIFAMLRKLPDPQAELSSTHADVQDTIQNLETFR
ncbi:TPA: hypothetical protein ACH3X1_003464 [Trebouxia sp. C0004]